MVYLIPETVSELGTDVSKYSSSPLSLVYFTALERVITPVPVAGYELGFLQHSLLSRIQGLLR